MTRLRVPGAADAPLGLASLPEAYRSVAVPRGANALRRFLAFMGPGYLVAVGYMDPGNWATDIAGGSGYGYGLLCVVLLANVMAMLLQALSAKLGIMGGLDLAQACRRHYSRPVNLALWVLCELAIIATDLAEVIGTAIALQLLFGLPLVAGIALTTFDVFLILALQRFGFRKLEMFVMALMMTIGACFLALVVMAQPNLAEIAKGLAPSPRIISDPEMLLIAIGILGATIMPHNLYLHSSVVQTRAYDRSERGRRAALKLAVIDSSVALVLAGLINGAIVVVAASAFHAHGRFAVTEIQEAHTLLSPLLGASAASTLFAVALLGSGQNSTVTGTLAGQIVMEGFLDIRLKPWMRRLLTRLIAVVPALFVSVIFGEHGTGRLLIFSQVILSIQLSFAVIPLIQFTGNKIKMGEFVNSRPLHISAWVIALIIISLNIFMLINIFFH